jgi:ribosomal protein S18 acetylase RimI-like enzyme
LLIPNNQNPIHWYNANVKLSQIQDRNKLAAYFRQDLPLYAYNLGDLDDLYWPRTVYFGEITEETINRVSTLYYGAGLPVFLALGPEGTFGEDYFQAIAPFLPDPVYAHLSPGLIRYFQDRYDIIEHGEHYKMSLITDEELSLPKTDNLQPLNKDHLPELLEFYDLCYPDNAFDPQMLSTGKYVGYRISGMLISVAGVHVYSSSYRVATLGNITTHPEYRNQGFARLVTSALCLDLINEVDFLGLNVKADNLPAIHLYQSLGFKIAVNYGEFRLNKQLFPQNSPKNH